MFEDIGVGNAFLNPILITTSVILVGLMGLSHDTINTMPEHKCARTCMDT
jgi:hypothetical protein